jgi:hypothetical protein
MTSHNIGHQGTFGADTVVAARPRPVTAPPAPGQSSATGRLNFLLTGIQYANAITTVSPDLRAGDLTRKHGVGLDRRAALPPRRARGILNGIDDTEWSPATRPAPRALLYGRRPVGQRARCKRERLLVGGAAHTAGTFRSSASCRGSCGKRASTSARRCCLAAAARVIFSSWRSARASPGTRNSSRSSCGTSRSQVVYVSGLQRAPRARSSRRAPTMFSHALALRAVWAEPDVLAALRHAADRAPYGAASRTPSRTTSRAATAAPGSCSITSTTRASRSRWGVPSPRGGRARRRPSRDADAPPTGHGAPLRVGRARRRLRGRVPQSGATRRAVRFRLRSVFWRSAQA